MTFFARILVAASFFGLGAMLVFFGRTEPRLRPATPSPPPLDTRRLAVGVLHVHSRYSDGIGDLSTISAAAAAAGLDFWVLTDHQRLDALTDHGEGYDDGVLRLVGVEVSTDAGHVLGLDLPATPARFSTRSEEVLPQISELGGFALAAHPDADRADFAWKGWDSPGYHGMEIFNTYSAYRSRGPLRSLAFLLLSPYWQTTDLSWQLEWSPELLDRWSGLLQERRIPVWAGVDAHGGFELIDDYSVGWPSYETVFRTARNYLLLDAPLTGRTSADRELIYEALRRGQGYVVLDDHPGADRFRFWAERGDRIWPMGSDVALEGDTDPVTLRVQLFSDSETELRLLVDGVPRARSRSGELSIEAARPGVYWVEASIGVRRIGGDLYKPWIMSNPIALLPEDRLQARVALNSVEPYAQPLGPLTPARDFGDPIPVEGNSGCEGVTASPAPESGFRVRFELGTPPPEAPPERLTPFARCAVADRSPRDLSDFSGMRFRTRGDGIYRVNVELHDPNPRSSADGMEPWTISFLTSPEWREVVVPFDRFRSAGPASDGTLDLQDIGAILFLFDTWNTRPGTAGIVEIEEISFWKESSGAAVNAVRSERPSRRD